MPRPRYWQDLIEELKKHLETYTLRKLSYPTDSLNAFRGILNHYSHYSNGKNLSSIFGLPVIMSSYSTLIASLAYSICIWHHRSNSESTVGKRIQQLPSWTWAGWEGVVRLDTIPVKWGEDFAIPVRKALEPSIAGTTLQNIWNSQEETAITSYFSLRLLDGSSPEHLEMPEIGDGLHRLAPYFVLNQPYVLEDVDFRETIRSSICARFCKHTPFSVNEGLFHAYFSTELPTHQGGLLFPDSNQIETILMGIEGRGLITFRFLIVHVKRKNELGGIEYIGERIGTLSVNCFLRKPDEVLFPFIDTLLVRRDYTLRVE
jgi:hypothetical protein